MTAHATSRHGSRALALSGVTVRYPDGAGTRTILDAVDLELRAGELTVISGRSGSGKSTLLTVAGLLRRPGTGEVTIAGIATSGLSERQRTRVRRDHIAIVYQSANLLPALTAVEQLELVGHVRGEPARTYRARARGLLAELELADRAGQLPSQLSGGERQRVGIARALMASPTVLIADEPTASLDPERGGMVAEILARVTATHGLATLVVAHDLLTRAHADRHLHLESGRLDELVAT
jgi:putative ABC transport system ATP-binding protein